MKLLLTSDWQMSHANLDKVQTVVDQIVGICKEQKITTVIHGGDVKEHYSPIQVQVINAGVRHTNRLKEEGIRFIVQKGNHDRSSMSDTSEDWFPALKHAGAETISKTTVLELGKGFRLLAVPYQTSNEQATTMFSKVAASADPNKSILLFHNEVKGCRANAVSKLPDGVPIRKLYPEKHLFCFGGHIHLHQKLAENTYYIGSPFCQDWREANQRKGYLVVDLIKKTVKFIPSKLQAYYDESWPGFPNKRDWKNCSVRVHVAVPEKVYNIGAYLLKQRTKAEHKYPGADIVTVPEFSESTTSVTVTAEGTDHDNITSYVDATCPEDFSKDKSVALLAYYLKKVGGFRSKVDRLRLISAKAKNFLSFKELDISYGSKGITVVIGKNKDWGSKSNGAGKSSLLQLPLVAFFGKTLKDQANDHWTSRFSGKQNAFVDFRFRTSDNSRCRIHRSRRPVKLRLSIDGKDRSTGIGVRGTQTAIEQITGLSWDTVVNTMYVDQSEVNALLLGTDAARKSIFGKFLNLDRFEKARELIKHRMSVVDERLSEVAEEKTIIKSKIQHIENFLEQMPKVSPNREKSKLKKLVQDAKRFDTKYQSLEKLVAKKQVTESVLTDKYNELTGESIKLRTQIHHVQEHIEEIQSLKSPKCPTCFQTVDKGILKNTIVEFRGKKISLGKLFSSIQDSRKQVVTKLRYIQSMVDKWSHAIITVRNKLITTKADIKNVETKLQDIRQMVNYKKKCLRDITKLKKLSKVLNQSVAVYDEEKAFLKYTMDSFSKNGLPMYLAGQLCPQLNKAAKYYSEVFSDRVITVQFQLTSDSVDVTVTNVHGGEQVKDQSQGELRIASLIVCFALQEVMSPTNVMILDEPGEGLDSDNASLFAQGLKQVADRFGSVWVTTHNPYILSELENERMLKVIKTKGVSRITTNTV